MNTHYRFRTITDASSVPNIGKVFGARRALRWLVALGAAVMIAVGVMSLDEFGATGTASVKGSATVRAVNAVPLISPEEQAFIDRVRHARIDSVGGRVALKPTNAAPLIGPEEQAFIDRVRHARADSVGGPAAIESSKAEPLIGPEEQAFIDHLRARLASVVRVQALVSRHVSLVGPQ